MLRRHGYVLIQFSFLRFQSFDLFNGFVVYIFFATQGDLQSVDFLFPSLNDIDSIMLFLLK